MQRLWLFVLFFLAAVSLTTLATPVLPWGDMKTKHAWPVVPLNWETLGHPSAGSTIDLHIVLKPDLESALIDAVSEISNPKHSRYRAFLSEEQVNELVRPSPDTVELVCAWLAHNGIPSSSISRTHGGTWLTVSDLRVTQASELLGASYQLYRNIKTNETIIRTGGYSLPEALHTRIQTVAPTTCFPSMEVVLHTPHKRAFGTARAQAQAASGKLVTRLQPPPLPPPPPILGPAILRWLYRTIVYQPVAYGPGQNSLAVVGSQSPSWGDLTDFVDTYRAGGADASFTFVPLTDNMGDPGLTSNVAVQYATAMAYPTPLFFLGTTVTDTSLVDLLLFLMSLASIPQTISISYNYFFEPVFPEESAEYICFLFARLAVRGVSVLVASGNRGVGNEHCVDREGNVKFVPEFPSSCPYVTSVGGTEHLMPEVATDLSGGGFSNYHPRLPYQDDAVNGFFDELGAEYAGLYNRWGRGYPDISAQAYGCRIVFNGVPDVLSGTACAVSTAAGIFSMLNDFLISQNREPLGFLNPWLYDEGRAGLTDIVEGSNPGCGTDGFSAVAGWDPVTGLGTPNFQLLLEAIPPDPPRSAVPQPP